MNRPKLLGGLARFYRRPSCKRASYARIWVAANQSPLHAAKTRSAQVKGPKMRGGLAHFRTRARSQSGDRQTVGGGQQLTNLLSRRWFSPNEPLEIARGPRAFPAETRSQTHEQRPQFGAVNGLWQPRVTRSYLPVRRWETPLHKIDLCSSGMRIRPYSGRHTVWDPTAPRGRGACSRHSFVRVGCFLA